MKCLHEHWSMICPHEILQLTSTGTVLLTSGWSNYNLSLSKNSGDSCSLENTTVNTEPHSGGQCGHSVVIPTYHYRAGCEACAQTPLLSVGNFKLQKQKWIFL